MNLKGQKVLLRAIEKEDLPLLQNMINDDELERMVVGWSLPVSSTQQEQWFEDIAADNNKVRFSVELEKEFIGTVILENIDWKNRNLEISIKLFKSKKEGLGTDTIKTILKFTFEELNMNKIEANILDYNIASIKTFEKCGFKLDGRKRQAVYKNGKYNDVLNYSILKDEYIKD